jgi:hypothetical protein
MLLAAAVLLLQFPVLSASNLSTSAKTSEPASVSRVADEAPVASAEAGASSAKAAVKTEVAFADANSSSMSFAPGRLVAEPITPLNSAAPAAANADPSPVAIEPTPLISSYRPVYAPPVRTVSDRWQKREWLALSIAAHGGAGFDAWTTRKVLSNVPGAQEMNPLLRPFAGNASMYAAVQVAPTILDYVSLRMMHSRYDVLRHTWWLPQAVSAVVSVASGVHNIGVYNSR